MRRKEGNNSRKEEKKMRWMAVMIVVGMIFVNVFPSLAIDLDFGGGPIKIMGYTSQSAGFGISGDHYDTKKGFQSGIFQGLLEVDYSPTRDLKFFISGKVNADWSYAILRNNHDWDEKGFQGSRDHLYIFGYWQDLLYECHATWTPGDFLFRVGKQIVVWGETDGFRLVDQINPIDQRRGIGDVRFESTILPIWLVRAEYNPPLKTSWLQSLNIQFIFNPNLSFRGNEAVIPGNDKMGIWAPNVEIPLGGPYPFDFAHLGSLNETIDAPDKYFDHNGFEYGLRLKSIMFDSIITLSFFYGRDNDRVSESLPIPPQIGVSPFDNRLIIHPALKSYYPRFKFVGLTFTRDLEMIKSSFLGGVSPVLRLETLYGFDSTFATSINTFDKSDEFRLALGIDWKVKIPVLNAKAYFMISPQFFYRRIIDYPSGYELSNNASLPPGLYKNNYQTSLFINTTYFHNKLKPSFFWLYDISNNAHMFRPELAYEQSNQWLYALGAILVQGEKIGKGFQVLENKDQIYLTATYRF